MSASPNLEELVRQHDALTLQREEVVEEEEQCIYAQQYDAYLRIACQDALNNPTHLVLNECYLEMFKKFMEWRTVVPKSHRNRIGEKGHRCLFHVLEKYYQLLRLKELALPSPKLWLPTVVAQEVAPLPPPPLLPNIFVKE